MIDTANFSSLRECISLVNYSLGPLKDSVFTPTPLSFWPKFRQWPEERVVNVSSRTTFLGWNWNPQSGWIVRLLSRKVCREISHKFWWRWNPHRFLGYFWSWRHELNPPFLCGPTYHTYLLDFDSPLVVQRRCRHRRGHGDLTWLLLFANILRLLKIVNVRSAAGSPDVFSINSILAKRPSRKFPEVENSEIRSREEPLNFKIQHLSCWKYINKYFIGHTAYKGNCLNDIFFD